MRIFRDTLTNPQTGRYSRKSVTAFASFFIAVVLAMSHHFFGYTLNETIFNDFLLLGGGSIMLSSAEKAYNKHKDIQKNETGS